MEPCFNDSEENKRKILELANQLYEGLQKKRLDSSELWDLARDLFLEFIALKSSIKLKFLERDQREIDDLKKRLETSEKAYLQRCEEIERERNIISRRHEQIKTMSNFEYIER